MLESTMPILSYPEEVLGDGHNAEWHARRMQGIGGSESAAVLGESHYQTAYAVWKRKTGQEDTVLDNPAMKAGRTFEQPIRQEYSNLTGRVVRDPGFKIHDKYPFVVGDVDGLCDDRILEIKTSAYGYGYGDGEQDIPVEYFLQVQHYMMLFNMNLADLFVLIHGQEFRCYTIEANPDLWESMVEIYASFWQNVKNRIPPEVQTLSDVNDRWRNGKDSSIVLTPEAIANLERIKNNNEQIKKLEESNEQSRVYICSELQESSIGTDLNGRTLVTWKNRKPSTKFDSKRLLEEHPEFKDYTITGASSRTFLIK